MFLKIIISSFFFLNFNLEIFLYITFKSQTFSFAPDCFYQIIFTYNLKIIDIPDVVIVFIVHIIVNVVTVVLFIVQVHGIRGDVLDALDTRVVQVDVLEVDTEVSMNLKSKKA